MIRPTLIITGASRGLGAAAARAAMPAVRAASAPCGTARTSADRDRSGLGSFFLKTVIDGERVRARPHYSHVATMAPPRPPCCDREPDVVALVHLARPILVQ